MLKDYQFKSHQCKVGRFIIDSAKFKPILFYMNFASLTTMSQLWIYGPPVPPSYLFSTAFWDSQNSILTNFVATVLREKWTFLCFKPFRRGGGNRGEKTIYSVLCHCHIVTMHFFGHEWFFAISSTYCQSLEWWSHWTLQGRSEQWPCICQHLPPSHSSIVRYSRMYICPTLWWPPGSKYIITCCIYLYRWRSCKFDSVVS